jgi:ABC-type Fe3+-hydroxamate transport system substrate-binding protein
MRIVSLVPSATALVCAAGGRDRLVGEAIDRSIRASLETALSVYVADGNAYFNRPGPRIVDSLEILAAAIHPEAFGAAERLVALL